MQVKSSAGTAATYQVLFANVLEHQQLRSPFTLLSHAPSLELQVGDLHLELIARWPIEQLRTFKRPARC